MASLFKKISSAVSNAVSKVSKQPAAAAMSFPVSSAAGRAAIQGAGFSPSTSTPASSFAKPTIQGLPGGNIQGAIDSGQAQSIKAGSTGTAPAPQNTYYGGGGGDAPSISASSLSGGTAPISIQSSGGSIGGAGSVGGFGTGLTSTAQSAITSGLTPPDASYDPKTGIYTYTAPEGAVGTAAPQQPDSLEALLGKYLPQKESVYNDSRFQQAEQEVLQAKQRQRDVSNRITTIVNKANADALSLTGQGRGIPEAIIGGQQAQIYKEAAIQALPLQAQLAAAQGDTQAAEDHRTQLLGILKESVDNNFQYKQTLFTAVYNQANDKQKAQLTALAKSNEDLAKTQNDTLALAVQNGAPPSVINAIRSAKNSQEAILAGGRYGQEMKAGSGTGAEATSDDLQAYAANYSDTGTLPSPAELKLAGLNVGQVTSYAKQLPKPTGALVSTNTGTKPKSLSPTQEQGITALSEIVRETLPALKDRFGKINTGIIGGTVGSLWTSQDRQDYKTFRAEFLSKLLSARSGAAVTEQEYQRYSDLLPTTFNQPLFFGSDGMKKLNAVESSMTTGLNNILNNQQLSIYGYSKVDVNGTPRTVGEVLDIGGTRYRVLTDGTLTDVF